MLQFRGAIVSTARTADEVLGLLATQTFDVLLADLGMPGQDGYALIEAIRRHTIPEVRQIKAIAVTAYSGDTHRARAFESGYDDYLVKPVAVNRLARAIVELMARPAGSSLPATQI
jgi:CheY-like chemotaxis protein